MDCNLRLAVMVVSLRGCAPIGCDCPVGVPHRVGTKYPEHLGAGAVAGR